MNHPRRSVLSFAVRSTAGLSSTLLIAALTGCAVSSSVTTLASKGLSMKGSVHGGQQPIAGAHIYLFSAASNGYGNSSVSLLDPVATGLSDSVGAYVLSDSTGSFSIGGSYSCTPNSQVYLYAAGGDPGAGTNSASGLMAVLGNCPSTGNFASATPFLAVNEVTTVAAAYALSGFAIDATHVASSGTTLALAGIANAFAGAANLVDLPSGSALSTTPAGNGTVPSAKINTLANILAACINSTGPGSVPCTTLLGEATSDGTSSGAAPSDTASAAINIAHNPGANVHDLFNLVSGVAPFPAALSTQPNDFTLALNFTGNGLRQPSSVAIDASGNAWIVNQLTNTVTELSPSGVPATNSPFGNIGLSYSSAIAIDTNGNAWIPNWGSSSITAIDLTGTPLNGSPFSGGALNHPHSIAFDPSGRSWLPDTASNTASIFTASGNVAVANGISGNGLNSPYALAIDPTGNAWIANRDSNTITAFDSNQNPLPGSPFAGNGLDRPFSVTIDGAGNVWSANNNGNTLSVFNSTGNSVSGSPFSGGGLSGPTSIAFDGAGNAWVANNSSQGVSLFSGTGTPATGAPFTDASLNGASFVAVDGSGNVWITNASGDSVTQLIGAAIPVVTPIVTGVAHSTIATRP